MPAGPQTRLAISENRFGLWLRRFLLFSPFLIGTLGLALVINDLRARGSGFAFGPVWLAILVFVAGVVVGLVLSLWINAIGVSSEGIAPPLKPANKLFIAHFVIPWKDLTSVGVTTLSSKSSGEPSASAYLVTLRLRDGDEILFTSRFVANRLGGKSEARRFREVLVELARSSLPPDAVQVQ